MSDGETWTREALTELRASRFTPSAWTRFLTRSVVRARERRAERPREHRTVVVLAAAGLALWSVAAVAGRPWLAVAGGVWWLAQALMLDWHLGLLERPDGSRLDGLGSANLLTIVRGGLAPALVVLAGSGAGVVLLVLAGAADVADGRLARRRDEATLLGVWLDGAVDTFVVGAAALGATLQGLLPAWATTLVVLRLVLPWLLATGVYFGRAERPPSAGLAAGRLASLAAGATVFAGLALAFLHAPGAAAVVAAGAVGGIAALVASVRRTLAAVVSAP
ncbi:MAG TPA: CDP-alcohol phosphatidyltransferase family protein [Gaiellaceae bacterium]|nr:CDP-alcohol phosphatidyltransferase family protein [Gaiellaceae bacterium]